MDQELYAAVAAKLTDKQAAAKAELLAAGNTAFDAEDFERALDCYHRASLVDGSDARVWNALGMAYFNLEFNREAWRSYKLSLQCDAENPETLWYAGEFLYNVEDLQLSLAILSRYREIETDSEKLEEAVELISEIRELLGAQAPVEAMMGNPETGLLEDTGDDDEFEGFEVEGEDEEPEESDFDDDYDEFHEGAEKLLEDDEKFVASLSLQLTTMDSKCTSCATMIPQDAPYCYSCKAPHFYE